MNIVHLVPHVGLGGDITIVKSMVAAAESQGHVVLVNGLEPKIAFEKGQNPFPLNKHLRGFLDSLKNMDMLFRNTHILHVHSPICLLFAWVSRLLKSHNAGIVFTFHWPVPDSGLRKLGKLILFNQCDRLHVYSSDMASMVSKRYQMPLEKVEMFPIGVESGRFSPKNMASAQEGEKKDFTHTRTPKKTIGYLGRLASEKNVDYLIRFLDRNHRRYPDLHVRIVGDGDLADSLKLLANQSPAKERITFTGHTKDPEHYYQEFDLLVLPSTFESFALVIVEAAYCATPSLRSDAEGSRDQISDGRTGFLYPLEGGYPAMESALCKILDDAWQQLPAVGAAARTHCLELCDMGRFTQHLHAMYEDVRKQKT